MTNLTDKQKEVFQTISRFFEEENRPPTTRELAGLLGKHIKTIYQYVQALERKGFIEKRQGRIHVAEKFRHAKGIPVVNHLIKKTGLLAEENIIGHLDISRMYLPGADLFAMQISDDSMEDARIAEGDTIIVQRQGSVENGEIGVVLVDGEALIRRIFIFEERIRLIAENAQYLPMIFDATHAIEVLGKIVGVFQKIDQQSS